MEQKQTPRTGRADAVSVVLALAAVAASLALAVILVGLDEPVRDLGPAAAAAEPQPPGPLLDDPDALAVARRSGPVLVGLLAREGGPIELHVYGEEEEPLEGGAVTVAVDGGAFGRVEQGPSCGKGCYPVDIQALAGAPIELAVSVARPGKPAETIGFSLPARIPARGDVLLARAKRVMSGLRSLRVEEVLGAGAGTLRSRWSIKAPDRVEIVSSDGGRTVIVGAQRWDLVDGEWLEGASPGERQPWYPWAEAANARVLGTAVVDGREVTKLAALVSEPDPWWFVLWVAGDGKVLREHMLAPSHFMVDRFSGFDEPVSIEPPVP